MFEIFGLLVLSPLLMWIERSQRFRMLPPLEQNLQRAALVALVLLFLFYTSGVGGVLGFFPWLARDPANAWPGLLLVPLGYGGALAYRGLPLLGSARRAAGRARPRQARGRHRRLVAAVGSACARDRAGAQKIASPARVSPALAQKRVLSSASEGGRAGREGIEEFAPAVARGLESC